MANYSENKRLDKIPKEIRSSVEQELSTIAEKIKKRRESKGFSQEKLAELIDVAPTTIQSIENQRTRPSLEVLIAIIKVLEMKLTLK